MLGRHVRRLEFLDVLLGDQPALTPVESFYQRILAGDTDEVRDHAEGLLKERSLSSYYDEVALKGLQLAAVDAHRGNLRPDQLASIRTTIVEVIGDLKGHPDEQPAAATFESAVIGPSQADADTVSATPAVADVDDGVALPPEWRGERAVACVAGRGPLDKAAAAMLVQILAKHNIGGRVVPYSAAARDRIGEFTAGEARMICISYLELSGEPSHLRYLIERLRHQVPGIPVVVGIWPAGEAILSNPAMARSMGADHYTSSLSGAVEVAVVAARSGPGALASLSPVLVAGQGG